MYKHSFKKLSTGIASVAIIATFAMGLLAKSYDANADVVPQEVVQVAGHAVVTPAASVETAPAEKPVEEVASETSPANPVGEKAQVTINTLAMADDDDDIDDQDDYDEINDDRNDNRDDIDDDWDDDRDDNDDVVRIATKANFKIDAKTGVQISGFEDEAHSYTVEKVNGRYDDRMDGSYDAYDIRFADAKGQAVTSFSKAVTVRLPISNNKEVEDVLSFVGKEQGKDVKGAELVRVDGKLYVQFSTTDFIPDYVIEYDG